MFYHYRHLFFAGLVFVLTAASLPACSGGTKHSYRLAPASVLSQELLSAPASVQEAYRFAFANPEILKQIPCYCGCGSMGHRNNYDCYVLELYADGSPQFETHALG